MDKTPSRGHQKIDRYFLFVGIFLLLLSIVAITTESYNYLVSSDVSKLKAVGAVESKLNDVRRKTYLSYAWLPLIADESVYDGDYLFTGTDSYTSITLSDGGQLKLSPKSLVRIKRTEKVTSLDLKFGSLSGQMAKNTSLSLSTIEGKNIVLNATEDAEIHISHDKLKNKVIDVFRGQIQIGQNKISNNQRLKVSAEKKEAELEEKTLEMISPKTDEVLWISANDPVTFLWKNKKDKASTKLIVAKDPSFSAPLIQEVFQSSGFKLGINHLKETGEEYHWRIESGNDRVDSHFKVLFENPPNLIFPTENEQIVRKPEDSKSVWFQWAPVPYTNNYLVQVSKNRQFSEVLYSVSVKKSNAVFENHPTGQFYWRVKVQDRSRDRATWSRVVEYQVSDVLPSSPVAQNVTTPAVVEPKVSPEPGIPQPAPPEQQEVVQKVEPKPEVKPEPKVEAKPELKTEIKNIVLKFQPKTDDKAADLIEKVELRWPKSAGAEWVEFSSDSKFTKILTKKEASGVLAIEGLLKPGVTFARVISSGKEVARYQLAVKSEAPKTLTDKQTQRVPANEDQQKHAARVALRWTAIPHAEKYQIEVSKDATFQNKVHYESSRNLASIQPPESGKFFWRVRGATAANVAVSDYSSVSPFEYQRIRFLPTPEITFPSKDHKYFEREYLPSDLSIQWKGVAGAAQYRLEMSRDSEFSELIFKMNTKNHVVPMMDGLQDGKVYIRVRAENGDALSDWSLREVTIFKTGEAPPEVDKNLLEKARLKKKSFINQ